MAKHGMYHALCRMASSGLHGNLDLYIFGFGSKAASQLVYGVLLDCKHVYP